MKIEKQLMARVSYTPKEALALIKKDKLPSSCGFVFDKGAFISRGLTKVEGGRASLCHLDDGVVNWEANLAFYEPQYILYYQGTQKMLGQLKRVVTQWGRDVQAE